MQALSPQQAKDLLGLMTRQGLLQTQATYNTATAAIPAVFGSQVNSEVQVSLQCLLKLPLFCQHWSRSCSVRDNIEMLVEQSWKLDMHRSQTPHLGGCGASSHAVFCHAAVF